MTKKGTILIFTGGRGVGKTTQANLCAKELKNSSLHNGSILKEINDSELKELWILDGSFFYDMAVEMDNGLSFRKSLNKYSQELGHMTMLSNIYNVCVINISTNVEVSRERKALLASIVGKDKGKIDWQSEERIQETLVRFAQDIYIGQAKYYNIKPPKDLGGIQIKDLIQKDIISSLI